MKERKNPTLELFCQANKEYIVDCAWYETAYCQRSCKYYHAQRGERSPSEPQEQHEKD